MTNEHFNFITIGMSVLALLVSAYSAFQSRNANKNGETANTNAQKAIDMQKTALNLQEAALESEIANTIATATKEVREAVLALSNVHDSAPNYPIVYKNFTSAQEVWLNAHDQACMSYRENKLNKDTFKKTYHVPIRTLFEDKDLQHFFSPVDTSKYPSIIAVYREWETSQR
ncbi:hypothetical protein UXO46_16475 [Enterobacter asburiae]|uniref:hypothetical protein n=1 Tax=Enterobacter asburiae TaxID=61645 RepID=UPI002FD109A5